MLKAFDGEPQIVDHDRQRTLDLSRLTGGGGTIAVSARDASGTGAASRARRRAPA